MVGIKSPASERIGLHSLGAVDVESLRDLIEHQRAKSERTIGHEVRVLCNYEAGYEGFWLARWLDRVLPLTRAPILRRRSLRVANSAPASRPLCSLIRFSAWPRAQ